MIHPRAKRTALLSILAVFIGAGLGWCQIQMAQDAVESESPMAGADIGGDFTLLNENGETITQAAYDGQYKLIYFGFTFCPAICPTELQKITSALKKMEDSHPELAAKIQPLFISIDPERDTPDVMREYVSLFHPRLDGLTGSSEQIAQVKKDYRIYAQKVQDENMSDYTMDHSSFIYLMAPDNRLINIYKIEDSAEYIHQDILKYVE